MEHAKQYFDNHTTIEKLYFTSDQLAFFDEQKAADHAKNLEDTSVTAMTREEADKVVADITGDDWTDDLPDDLDME